MKKPVISFGGRFACAKFLIAAALCLSAALLFLLPEESVAVFSDGGERAPRSLFELIKKLF